MMQELKNDPVISSVLPDKQLQEGGQCVLEVHFQDGEIRKISALPTDTILKALHQNGIPLAAPCGGVGRCGGCLVTVSECGSQVAACQDIIGSRKQLWIPNEWKAAEQSVVLTQAGVLKTHTNESEMAQGAGQEEAVGTSRAQTNASERQEQDRQCYNVAIDIGTTTIGLALFDSQTGSLVAEYGCMNSQRIHGSDVMARIRYGSCESGLNELRIMAGSDIRKGLYELNVPLSSLINIGIAANTTMLHLLQGLNPSAMGRYPFTPQDVNGGIYSFNQIFGESEICPASVWILPCASAFIGADLTAGAAYLSMGTGEEIDLLVDLGTNGEMILGNQHSMLGTSAAAGPAFEACLHSQGVKGAQMLDYLADALRRGFLNPEGLIGKRYFERGIPCADQAVLTQSMVRSIQLAKAAIHAGIHILIQEYGITPSEIRHVYLAGGFGFHLNRENAIYLGMLPKILKNKIRVAGNTALLGAAACLQDPEIYSRTQVIASRVQNIDLANTKDFSAIFLDKMNFGSS